MSPPDALARILAYKREEVARRKAARPVVDAGAAGPVRGFAAALKAARDRPALIAEVKKASPSKGLIRADFDPAAIAKAYAEGGAACLSVLTDAPSFQGEDAFLGQARNACALPVLRKEFLIDPWQVAESRALGADAILVILAAVDDALAGDLVAEAARHGLDVLLETHDEAEMDRALALDAPDALIGINNRNLKTFETSLETFERLAPRAANRFVVAESGIASPDDISRLARAGAGAFLVGESLMRATDVAAATRALLAP